MKLWTEKETDFLKELYDRFKTKKDPYPLIYTLFLEKYPERNKNQIRKKIKREKRRWNEIEYSKKYDKITPKSNEEIDDIILENIKLEHQVQQYRDKETKFKKSFRQIARYNSEIYEKDKEFKKILSEINKNVLTSFSPQIPTIPRNNERFGIIHLSDWHLNELIDLQNNQYNFRIASIRLKFYITKAISQLKYLNVSTVILALTGDFINSSRRKSEQMSMETNQSKAVFVAVELLSQIITELLRNNFSLYVASVVGNESRLEENIDYVDVLLSHNYDFIIFNILKLLFKDVPNITFGPNNPDMTVIDINNFGILLIHGETLSRGKIETELAKIRDQKSLEGIKIDIVLFGHIHQAYLSDNFFRSSGLPGGNDYSYNKLKLVSRSSQNLYVIENGRVDALKIDLQGVENEPEAVGYNLSQIFQNLNIEAKLKSQETKLPTFQIKI